jgi:hypothetical protein
MLECWICQPKIRDIMNNRIQCIAHIFRLKIHSLRLKINVLVSFWKDPKEVSTFRSGNTLTFSLITLTFFKKVKNILIKSFTNFLILGECHFTKTIELFTFH